MSVAKPEPLPTEDATELLRDGLMTNSGYDQDTADFVSAIMLAEARDNTTALVNFIRSERPLSAQSRHLLADLLKRRRLVRRRGRQQTPAYGTTLLQQALDLAKEEFAAALPRPNGMHEREELIREIAERVVRTIRDSGHLSDYGQWAHDPEEWVERIRSEVEGDREQSRMFSSRKAPPVKS